MTTIRFEAALVRALNAYTKSGGKLICGLFGSKAKNRCCALTALVGDGDVINRTSAKYGLSDRQIWSFVFGFDSSNKYNVMKNWYRLGEKIRKRYGVHPGF